MPIPGLTIIGESINDSVPSTHALFEANDIAGIVNLAKMQGERGAGYIDVNVGRRPPSFMADMVQRVQGVTARPLSIDTPDYEIAAAGLRAYNPDRAGGQPPILNSISPLRMSLLDLHQLQPFMPILMVSERMEGGHPAPNTTAEETYRTAKAMLSEVRAAGLANHQLILDPGIAPIGSDTEGNLKRVMAALRMIRDDPDFAGCHRSVGLSNFTVMLPSKRPDGMPVKGTLESAFLTLALPLGLDMIIGSVTRKYQQLGPDHPAMVCLQEVLRRDGFEALTPLREFYAPPLDNR
jgi:5-methyltetrahydrofolate--homocysteine methyltransferase